MSTYDEAKTIITSEEAQAAASKDYQKLVRLAGIAGCTAMTGGAGAAFCAFAFGGGFEGLLNKAFQALPSSMRAQGEMCYPCLIGDHLTDETRWRTFNYADGVRSQYVGKFVVNGILPTAQRYVDAGIKSLNASFHRGREVLGLSREPFDVWPHMQSWLYAVPNARWNSAAWIENKSDGSKRIELVPAKGPWAINYSKWPKRGDSCEDGCAHLFSKRLDNLYTQRLRDFDTCLRQAEKEIASMLAKDLEASKSSLAFKPSPSIKIASGISSQRRPSIDIRSQLKPSIDTRSVQTLIAKRESDRNIKIALALAFAAGIGAYILRRRKM